MNNNLTFLDNGLQKGLSEVFHKQQEGIISVIQTYLQDERESLKTEIKNELLEEVKDELIKFNKRNELDKVEIKERLDNVEEKSEISYRRTNTLSFTGKAKELSEKVKSIAYKYTGEKGSLEYILFYNKFISQIYKKLKDYYEVNSYTMIDSDSFDDCMRNVSKWEPKHNAKRNIIKEYQKLDDNGRLTEVKSKALAEYLDENGGKL